MRAARFLLLRDDLDDDAGWLTPPVIFRLLGQGVDASARRPTRPQWSVELVLDDSPADDPEMPGHEALWQAAVSWD